MEQRTVLHGSELDIMTYLHVIRKRFKLILVFVCIVSLIAIVRSFMQPVYYQTSAVIIPVTGGGSMMAMPSQGGGGLALLAGLGGGAGVQTPTQKFLALLRTRTLAEEIINNYDLMRVIFGNSETGKSDVSKTNGLKMENAVAALLGSYVTFTDDRKNGTLVISAEFEDPKLAADVANGYVEGLQKFLNNNSFTVAKRYRLFIEGQLAENKKNLLEAGKGLNEFYKAGRVSSVESKVDVPMDAQAVSELGLQVKSNEQIATLGSDLEQLNKQKDEIEAVLVVKDVPQQVYLQYMTLRRNLLAQINTLLTQQYEMAKMEEAKDELAFQVIDPARVPEKRSKPKRKQMVMMAFISALFFGIFAAFLTEYIAKLRVRTMGAKF